MFFATGPRACWCLAVLSLLGGSTHPTAGAASSGSDVRAWTKLWSKTPFNTGPIARQAHSAVACGSTSMVVFGGFGGRSTNDFLDDLWQYDVQRGTWSQILRSNSNASSSSATAAWPHARASHSSVAYVDPDTNECVVLIFGGAYEDNAQILQDASDLWSVRLAMPAPLPSPASGSNGTTAASGGSGGAVAAPTTTAAPTAASWQQLTPDDGVVPSARNEQVAVIRQRRGTTSGGWEMYIFGGVSGSENALTAQSDVWRYDLDTGRWTQPFSSSGGGQPAARFSHAGCLALAEATAVPLRNSDVNLRASSTLAKGVGKSLYLTEDSMIIFGGRDAGRGGTYSMLSDLWYFGLDTHTWTRQEINAPKLTRSYHSMVFYNSMVIVFAGYQRVVENAEVRPLGYVYNKVLVMTPRPHQQANWYEFALSSSVQPTVRFAHSAVQFGNKMLVYAGRFKQMRGDMYQLNVTDVQDNIVDRELAPNFQTLHFMIGVLSLMTLCFCVFIFSLRRRFRATQQVALSGSVLHGGAPERVINRLPVEAYHPPPEDEAGDNEDDMCPICLADYEEGDQLRILPCKHRFHPACVDEWLRTNKACPMCKRDVTEGPPSATSATSAPSPGPAAAAASSGRAAAPAAATAAAGGNGNNPARVEIAMTPIRRAAEDDVDALCAESKEETPVTPSMH